jgi:uncharacterized cupredoxin-like copper-binding protein
MFSKLLAIVACFFLTVSIWVRPAIAIDLAHQDISTIEVSLSNSTDELKFFPDRLAFQSGKRYKLHLTNRSLQKHYFTAKDFTDAIWSQKVDAGNVEIKGDIRELELRSNTEADWVFVPLRSGTYRLHCTIPGHTEAGMTGEIVVR